MKKSVAFWTVVYLVLLALLLVACAPAYPSNTATIPDEGGSSFNVAINVFQSDTGGTFYRLIDNSNGIVCYGRIADGISCIKK